MVFFGQCVSVIGAVVLGIMVLTVFVKLLGRLERGSWRLGVKEVAVEGLFGEKGTVTVRLSDGAVIEDVRIAGLTDTSGAQNLRLQEFDRMVILEHADGRRTVIPPKSIRRIELGAEEHA
jgi:hypothetical protein